MIHKIASRVGSVIGKNAFFVGFRLYNNHKNVMR